MEKIIEKLEPGDVVCFFEGKKDRNVAYTDMGKVILCKHSIPLGYAEIKTVEDRGRFFLVTAKHIVKDIYTDINYEDFMDVLPLHGYKIGFDRTFINPYTHNQEHQIYAYNLKNNVVIVADTYTYEGEDRVGFNEVDVYCPQLNFFEYRRSAYAYMGSMEMTRFNLAINTSRNDSGMLDWINSIMEKNESKHWPENSSPSVWTYADDFNADTCGAEYLDRLLDAPESLQIFEGCTFLNKLKAKKEQGE